MDQGSNELLKGSKCDQEWVVERRILQSDLYQITLSQHGIEFNLNQVFFRLRFENGAFYLYFSHCCK